MATQLCELPLASLAFDTDVQCREALRSETVGEYREAAQAGAKFPPLVVFYDGKVYWVADGFHRGQAFREAGLEKVPVDIRTGTKRDAILYAVGANASHGLRRTNADKRRAVETLLRDCEWSQWSDRELARRAGVSNQFVANLRPALSTVDSQEQTSPRKCADGRTLNVSNIGKKPAEAKPAPKAEREEPPVGLDDDEREDLDAGEEDFGGEKTEPMFSKEGVKPKPIADYQLVNTDTPEKIIALAITNIRETLDEAWDRCEPSQRWRLVSKVENLIAEFKEEKKQ